MNRQFSAVMPMRPQIFFLCLLTAPCVLRAGTVNFNRDVRPILSDNCFQCHGPDEKQRKGGLRLDLAEDSRKPAKSGAAAIVPGKPDASEMLQRIAAADPDDAMPPAKTGKKLTAEQAATLRQWIAEGGAYQGHWAFLPPERPAIPQPDAAAPSAWRENPIDAFLYERMVKAGLRPNAEADRRTLIRRVALDLTGLPPTPEEADAFAADTSPQAYEKVVDRLLASPRYGEKMAQQWLDFARYADSNGFQTDSSRQMWLWRDWVINAFNRNLPFDRFTIEQLAGDMLPGAKTGQIVATGFNRNHRLNGEGGRIAEEWFAETVIDRVETTGLTWMALTLNCCRCHDHKYDPISQKEFYQLFAYFNSVDESGVLDSEGGNRGGGNSRPTIAAPTAEQEAQLQRLTAAVKDAEARAAAAQTESAPAQAAWEARLKESLATAKQKAPWQPLTGEKARSEGGAILTRQADGSWLAGGTNPANDVYEVTGRPPAGLLTALILEALPDPSLPQGSVGRFSNGNFVLSGIDAELAPANGGDPVDLDFVRAAADYEQNGWPVASVLGDAPKPQAKPKARAKGKKAVVKNGKGWAVDGPTRKAPSRAIFILAAPVRVPENATLAVTLRHDALTGHNIGRFRLFTSSLPAEALDVKGFAAPPPELLAAVGALPAQRTKQQQDLLRKAFAESPDNPAVAVRAAVASAKKALDEFSDTMPTTMVMKELAQPREARVLKRGEYDKPQEAVARAVPAILPPLPKDAPNDRLGLAQWLVSGSHPLTARVWVNRAWERFFGTGIVKTTENLGSQSEWPSHPELLDWLATEFVRLNWDMKALQKRIALSAAYRQSARATPEALAIDPENRLLSRGPRFRLSAESVRDQALLVSGLLVEKIGGPSVRPYMPAGVWDETSVYGDLRGYKSDTGEGLYRRTLYTIWKRTAAPPTMLLFDSPSREICTVKRSRTNTPLQALAMMNEITFVEAARNLAQRMQSEGGATAADRISWAFRRATCRNARPEELQTLVSGYEKRLARFRGDPAAARELISQGASPPAAGADAAELASLTVTANILLNLDEVVTRE
jgi:hypothetical protein